jgi:hypothetical protein
VASSVRKLLEKKELAEALEGIDTSNIIEGGRRARRSTAPAPVPAPAVKKSKPEPSKPSKYTHQTLHSTVDFPRMSSQGVCVCVWLLAGRLRTAIQRKPSSESGVDCVEMYRRNVWRRGYGPSVFVTCAVWREN